MDKPSDVVALGPDARLKGRALFPPGRPLCALSLLSDPSREKETSAGAASRACLPFNLPHFSNGTVAGRDFFYGVFLGLRLKAQPEGAIQLNFKIGPGDRGFLGVPRESERKEWDRSGRGGKFRKWP